MLGISHRLLVEQTEVDDVGITPGAFRGCGVEDTVHTIEWSDSVSSGAVIIEAADNETYPGKWTAIQTVTFDGSIDPAPKADVVRVPGGYGAFKHRIVSPVLDGTVTSKIRGYV